MVNSNDQGLGYWLRWQVPVCALIIVAPSVLALYLTSKVKTDPLFFNDFWKPQWRKLNPCWLLCYRAFAFICMARILLELGTVFSAYGCWVCLNIPLPEKGARDEFLRRDVEENVAENSVTYMGNDVSDKIKLQSRYIQEEFQQRAGFWGYLMQNIYQTCAGAVILTDIVFWCVIVPFLSNSRLGVNMLMGCMHSLNAVFLILDTLLNSLPFPWFRLAYFVQWSCLYVVFQWVLHACGFTWWPYPFLELDTPWAPLWYFALAVVHIPCYGIYALITGDGFNSTSTTADPKHPVESSTLPEDPSKRVKVEPGLQSFCVMSPNAPSSITNIETAGSARHPDEEFKSNAVMEEIINFLIRVRLLLIVLLCSA
ncbi:hypothetical protein V6N13_131945 [Hibiscus sabdariffa]